MFHVSFLVVSLAFHHEHFTFLIHSSSYDTRTRSTIGTTRTTPRTPSTSRTFSMLPQSTSCDIKNHSGVKTCRVAENSHTTTPRVEADEKPTKKSKKNRAQGSVALVKESLQLGCVSQDSFPRILFCVNLEFLGSNHAVKFSKEHLAPN